MTAPASPDMQCAHEAWFFYRIAGGVVGCGNGDEEEMKFQKGGGSRHRAPRVTGSHGAAPFLQNLLKAL